MAEQPDHPLMRMAHLLDRYVRVDLASAYVEAVRDAGEELARAMELFPSFNSAHEGYAILLEEVHELWDEVRIRQSKRDPERLRTEAIQVAAMAIRFAAEIDGSK
jgi:hypothetical protein